MVADITVAPIDTAIRNRNVDWQFRIATPEPIHHEPSPPPTGDSWTLYGNSAVRLKVNTLITLRLNRVKIALVLR